MAQHCYFTLSASGNPEYEPLFHFVEEREMHVHNSSLSLEQFYDCSLHPGGKAHNVPLNRRQKVPEPTAAFDEGWARGAESRGFTEAGSSCNLRN